MMGKTEMKRGHLGLEPMVPVRMRICRETWEKLAWRAQRDGTKRADVIRSQLAEAVRDVEPPVDMLTKEIQATPEEWEKWRELARDLDTSVQQIVRKFMKQLVKKHFG